MNVNKVILVGNVVADPELRTTQSGQQVCTVRLATNRVWTDKTGKKQESPEFHSVILWGKLAQIASSYLKKGGMAFIEGRLATRSWDDTATGTKKYRTEIVAERLQLGPRSAGQGNSAKPQEEQAQEKAHEEIPIIEEDAEIDVKDIPF
ncbi:MAG: single-stranded DNA-binding protein [bacterium]|nr:single-stranded DNA-binding protein [bacterium]